MRFEFLKEHRGEIGPIKKACGLMKASKSSFYEHLGRKKPNAQIERGALEGLAVERLPSAQEPLRLPAHRPRTAKKRHRREREARAPYHAKARTRRKGRDPKTPHPEEGRAGRPSAEPGRARFLRGRAQQALGGRYHLHAHKRRVALSRSRDRRLLPQGRGRSMSERITEKVAIDAIGQAVGREGPPDDGSLVFHGDRGAQHASRSFRRYLGSHGVAQSVSRPGTPLDNAVAESFFKTLKRELAEERSHGTRDEAKQDILKHIEPYRNRVRMHSTLGYMSPVEYERQYA